MLSEFHPETSRVNQSLDSGVRSSSSESRLSTHPMTGTAGLPPQTDPDFNHHPLIVMAVPWSV